MKRIYHTCQICGKEFVGRRTRKYCSRVCHYADRPPSWNAGKTGLPGKPTTQVLMTCAHCGKAIAVHPYRVKEGTGKYCNQACYMAARWREDGTCKQCGKPCAIRFCSAICQKTYHYTHDHDRKQARYWQRKFALIAELGGKCVQCGIDDFRVLDIDHIDASKKVQPKNGHYSWTRRLHDWAQSQGNLQLLCANCHRLRTWEQRNFGPKEGH